MAATAAVSGLQRGLDSKKCPMCTFEARSLPTVISHIHIVHSSDPDFLVTCGLDGCATTSKSFAALYSHIYRNHPNIIKKRNFPNVSNHSSSVSSSS